jgi:hypothetical protein
MAGPATPIPQQQHPPPPIPSDPSLSSTLTNYLTQFSAWCRNGFADKLKSNVANPGVLLQAYDAPSGTTPKVFMIQVSTAGAIVATPVALGGGSVGTP